MFALLLFSLLHCGDLCTPGAAFWYDELLAQGGYGRFEHERAAFLIRERDGTLTLQPWDARDVRRATYRGAVPARAIAVLHTHPAREPHPSARDRAEAKRLGIPVLVITPRAVVAAMPHGDDRVIR